MFTVLGGVFGSIIGKYHIERRKHRIRKKHLLSIMLGTKPSSDGISTKTSRVIRVQIKVELHFQNWKLREMHYSDWKGQHIEELGHMSRIVASLESRLNEETTINSVRRSSITGSIEAFQTEQGL